MEVDNEYDWLMEEASFKPVDGPLPVSKFKSFLLLSWDLKVNLFGLQQDT